DDRDEHACVSGYGYWKNHRPWPVRTLVLGDPANPAHTYTQSELQQILDTPATGDGRRDYDPQHDRGEAKADASIILAYQLIAAKLNVARGSNPSPIASQLVAADRLLATFRGKLPYRVSPNTPVGASMVSLAGIFEDYNEGRMRGACKAP